MRCYLITLSIIITVFQAHNAVAQQFEHCNALISHGINNITRHKSAEYAIAYKWHSNCGTDFDSASDSRIRRASASVFGFGSGSAGDNSAHTRERLKKWCNENQEYAASRYDLFQEAQELSESSLLAWNQCQQIAKKNVTISFFPLGAHSRFVHFEIDSGHDGDLRFYGVKTRNYECEINMTSAEGSEVDISIRPVIRNANIHIDCERALPDIREQKGKGRIVYEAAYISVNTSGPALPVAFREVVEEYTVTPPSAVVAFASQLCPSGWEEYKRAYGRFVRGIDRSDKGIDPSGARDPGEFQADAFKEHTHPARMEIGAEPTSGAARAEEAAGAHGRIGTNYTAYAHILREGGLETRPRNVSLLYCVKL